MPSEWITIHVGGRYADDGGMDSFLQDRCGSLAEAGYVVATPYFYHRQTEPSIGALHWLAADDPRRLGCGFPVKAKPIDSEIAVDADAARALLRGLPSVGNSSQGITGFCLGGRIAELPAVRSSEFGAAAAERFAAQ